MAGWRENGARMNDLMGRSRSTQLCIEVWWILRQRTVQRGPQEHVKAGRSMRGGRGCVRDVAVMLMLTRGDSALCTMLRGGLLLAVPDDQEWCCSSSRTREYFNGRLDRRSELGPAPLQVGVTCNFFEINIRAGCKHGKHRQ